jgi:hypothetical protein
MSSLFEEVEFKVPKSPADQKPEKVVIWDPEKLKEAAKKIEAEVEKIKLGTSEYHPHAVNPSSFGFPASNALKVFLSDPNDERFKGFVQIAKQDWGIIAAAVFREKLLPAREEKPNE